MNGNNHDVAITQVHHAILELYVAFFYALIVAHQELIEPRFYLNNRACDIAMSFTVHCFTGFFVRPLHKAEDGSSVLVYPELMIFYAVLILYALVRDVRVFYVFNRYR